MKESLILLTESQLAEEIRNAYIKGKSDGLDIALKHLREVAK